MAAAKRATTVNENNADKSTNTSNKKKPASKKSRKSKAEQEKIYRRKVEEVNEYKDRMAFETALTMLVLSIIAVFLYLSYFGLGGIVGRIFGGFAFGIFGWSAWLLPLAAIIGYIFAVVNSGDRRVKRKIISSGVSVWLLLGITDILFKQELMSEYYSSHKVMHKGYFDCMNLTLEDVFKSGRTSAGMLGRAISSIFTKITGEVGAVIIMFALFLLCLFIFNGVELMAAIRRRNAYMQEMEQTYDEISGAEDYTEPLYMPAKKRRRTSSDIRRSDNVMQSINLSAVNKSLDALDALRGNNPESASNKSDYKGKAKTDRNIKNKDKVKPDINTDYSNTLKTDINYNSTVDYDIKLNKNLSEKDESIRTDFNNENDFLNNQETDEERRRRTIAGIPIFREEMELKFGKKSGNLQTDTVHEGPQIIEIFKDDDIANDIEDFDTVKADNKNTSEPISIKANLYNENIATENNVEYKAPFDKENSIVKEEAFKEESVVTENEAFVKESAVTSDGFFKDENFVASDEFFEVESSVAKDEAFEVEKPVTRDEAFEIEKTVAKENVLATGLEKLPLPSHISLNDDKILPVKKELPLEEMSTLDVLEQEDLETNTTQENVQMPQPSYKRPEKTTNHGRIGGEGYVSASDTFNALNDSKEAEKEESKKEYVFPPIELLKLPDKSDSKMSDNELRNTASKLQETLQSFNVNVKMGAVTCGPTVTRYEMIPEQGVRVNKITNLADDLKLSLASSSIRIEAPIPGKSAVGIEVPNPEPGMVAFRELLEGEAFRKAKSPVTFAVGKDIAGKLVMTDIAKMPHLLIAGATGSGKSVCINTLIMSILYKANPDDVKLIMIDPKVVELSVYNGIPHLFCPVVTDANEAAAALNWAVREMMDRYEKIKELGVRNISGYNEKVKTLEGAENAGYKKMPFLVIIVDEFADLMMVASKEVEEAVCRLAQLARAAGIHLVLATQRPSVNVITGLIKANIPSRIAFSVSSATDSRTILDRGGAEKLIGKGDMLFFTSGYSEPVRVQGAFVSDTEVSDVVEFLCSNNEEPEYNENVTQIVEPDKEAAAEPKETKHDRDEYFEDAGRFVIESGRAAAGQLQRRFSIGFNRAGRIIDQLNKAGVVGPAEGTKPRKVLMSMNDFDLFLGNVAPVDEEEIEKVAQEFAGENEVYNEQF